MISPFMSAMIRRRGGILVALVVLLGLTVFHQAWYRPAAARYQGMLKKVSEMGVASEPGVPSAFLPPRLFALITDNSLSAPQAVTLGNSGALTAELLGDFAAFASGRGMQVLTTEPGPVSQLEDAVIVRAHLRLRGRYDQFMGLLEDVAASRKLVAIDRFVLTGTDEGQFLELSVSRLLLKRGEKTP